MGVFVRGCGRERIVDVCLSVSDEAGMMQIRGGIVW